MKPRTDGRYVKKIKLLDGTTKYLYSNAKSPNEAKKDFNRQMQMLQESDASKLLFVNIAERWDDSYQKRVSDMNYRKNTRAAYKRITEHFEKQYIEKILAPDINKFINKLILSGFSQKTVATHKSILNMIFNFAILEGLIESNPVLSITLPSNLPKKQRELPSDNELKIVNAHYDGFDLLPYFLLNTGMRMSEALAIDIEQDIDFENSLITVNKHLLHDNNKPVIEYKTKTKSSNRTVILMDRVAEKIPKRKGLLFCNEDGTPYTKKQLQCRWNNYQRKYGLSLTAHQLRHGFATMLFEAGIEEKDAQDLMGHSDIKLTRQIYTHVRAKRKAETAAKLNAFTFE